MERIGEAAPGQSFDERHLKKLVKDLSSKETYDRKHAAWTLARMAQKGSSQDIVGAGAVPELARCLDDEMIVKYRAVWALGVLAKHGQAHAVREADIADKLRAMAGDSNQVEICHQHTGELVRTTLGALAGDALALIGE